MSSEWKFFLFFLMLFKLEVFSLNYGIKIEVLGLKYKVWSSLHEFGGTSNSEIEDCMDYYYSVVHCFDK